MAGTPADICTLAAPSLRMRLGPLDDGWHAPTSENTSVSVEARDDQRLQVWVISQRPFQIPAEKMFCSCTATIACPYHYLPVPSWNTDHMFLKSGRMGIWHCCVTELVGLSSSLLCISQFISLGVVTLTVLKLQTEVHTDEVQGCW